MYSNLASRIILLLNYFSFLCWRVCDEMYWDRWQCMFCECNLYVQRLYVAKYFFKNHTTWWWWGKLFTRHLRRTPCRLLGQI